MDQGDFILTEVTMSVVFMGKKQGSLPVKTTDIVISDYIMNGLQHMQQMNVKCQYSLQLQIISIRYVATRVA